MRWLWFGILALAACGGTVVIDGAAGGAGGSFSSVGGSPPSTSSAGGCTSFVTCCDNNTGQPVGYECDATGTPFCPANSTFAPDGTCSGETVCFLASDCPSNAWCNFPDDRCGAGDPGTCVPRPQSCPDQFLPTCTCDGSIASNPCDGQAMGLDASELGTCPPPFASFACGSTFCEVGSQYCRREFSDAGSEVFFGCAPLPAGCAGVASCACLTMEPCGFQCEDSGGGAVTLTCPGG